MERRGTTTSSIEGPRAIEKEEAVVTRRWRRRGSSEGTKRFPWEWGLVGGSSWEGGGREGGREEGRGECLHKRDVLQKGGKGEVRGRKEGGREVRREGGTGR